MDGCIGNTLLIHTRINWIFASHIKLPLFAQTCSDICEHGIFDACSFIGRNLTCNKLRISPNQACGRAVFGRFTSTWNWHLYLPFNKRLWLVWVEFVVRPIFRCPKGLRTLIYVRSSECDYYMSEVPKATIICPKFRIPLMYVRSSEDHYYMSEVSNATIICPKFLGTRINVRSSEGHYYMSEFPKATIICPKFLRTLIYVRRSEGYYYMSEVPQTTIICPRIWRPLLFVRWFQRPLLYVQSSWEP